MNAVNRTFVALIALAWLALMGLIAYLVWNPGQFIEVTGSTLNARFEVVLDTTAERTLASIVIGLLMVPAVMLLMIEATAFDRRAGDLGIEAKLEHDRNMRLQSRVSELEKQLESERRRASEAPRPAAEREPSVATQDAGPGRLTIPRRWHLFGR